MINIIVFGPYRWWKELDVPNKLPFARDRIVESCLWALAIFFEPQYSTARQIMAKQIMLMTVIDDTYDAYGTIDELELFTNAIERFVIIDLLNKRTGTYIFPLLIKIIFPSI